MSEKLPQVSGRELLNTAASKAVMSKQFAWLHVTKTDVSPDTASALPS